MKAATIRRHLMIGWWSLFGFGAFGLGLELLHGLKIGAYLDVGNDTRRLMWTLAHAHGTLLGLIHIALSTTLASVPVMTELPDDKLRLISRSLVGSSILLPGGFFLGGVRFYAGDPGIGIAVVPIGAALLLFAALTVARAVQKSGDTPPPAAKRGRP